MKGIESLTRTLPVNPTGIFTPEAVEMPFDAFEEKSTRPPADCKEKACADTRGQALRMAENIGISLASESGGILGAEWERMTGNGKGFPQEAGQGQAESQVTASDVVGFVDFVRMVESVFH